MRIYLLQESFDFAELQAICNAWCICIQNIDGELWETVFAALEAADIKAFFQGSTAPPVDLFFVSVRAAVWARLSTTQLFYRSHRHFWWYLNGSGRENYISLILNNHFN